jgi:hypothetical protein
MNSKVIQISTCSSNYSNSIVTALCADWSIWQLKEWPESEFSCIHSARIQNNPVISNSCLIEDIPF